MSWQPSKNFRVYRWDWQRGANMEPAFLSDSKANRNWRTFMEETKLNPCWIYLTRNSFSVVPSPQASNGFQRSWEIRKKPNHQRTSPMAPTAPETVYP